jgi:hypothetical protein
VADIAACEVKTAFHFEIGPGFNLLGEKFAEDDLLGEVFGADDGMVGPRRGTRGEK